MMDKERIKGLATSLRVNCNKTDYPIATREQAEEIAVALDELFRIKSTVLMEVVGVELRHKRWVSHNGEEAVAEAPVRQDVSVLLDALRERTAECDNLQACAAHRRNLPVKVVACSKCVACSSLHEEWAAQRTKELLNDLDDLRLQVDNGRAALQLKTAECENAVRNLESTVQYGQKLARDRDSLKLRLNEELGDRISAAVRLPAVIHEYEQRILAATRDHAVQLNKMRMERDEARALAARAAFERPSRCMKQRDTARQERDEAVAALGMLRLQIAHARQNTDDIRTHLTRVEREQEAIRQIVRTWLDKQGHERCHYYPDLYRELAKALNLAPTRSSTLPPLAEFRDGCRKYQVEEYGEAAREEQASAKLVTFVKEVHQFCALFGAESERWSLAAWRQMVRGLQKMLSERL